MLSNEKTMTTDTDTDTDITDDIEHVAATLAAAKDQVVALEQRLKLARGTSDVTEVAAKVVSRVKALPARVEEALRAKPMATDELARNLGETIGKLSPILKEAKKAGKISNVGLVDQPAWVWKIGPNASPKDVQAQVLALISYQPMSFAQLCVATGVRGGLVQGALIEIRRRKDIEVHNLGTRQRARYLVLPPGAMSANLRPKRS